MALPRGHRFEVPFDVMFPQGAYLVGEIEPMTEYQSGEDRMRGRPVQPRLDEESGLRLFKGTIADPSAEKDRDKSITVTFAAKVQPVPPAAVPGMPFRPVVLDGLTVQPRAETAGQAKWITWSVRATGLRAVDAPGTTGKPAATKPAAGDQKQAA